MNSVLNSTGHILICGSTNSGKTSMAKKILNSIYKESVIVFTKNEHSWADLNMGDNGAIFNDNTDAHNQRLTELRVRLKRTYQQKINTDYAEEYKKQPFIIIYDDYIRELTNKTAINEAIIVARHEGIKIIALVHDPTDFIPSIRNNFNFVISSTALSLTEKNRFITACVPTELMTIFSNACKIKTLPRDMILCDKMNSTLHRINSTTLPNMIELDERGQNIVQATNANAIVQDVIELDTRTVIPANDMFTERTLQNLETNQLLPIPLGKQHATDLRTITMGNNNTDNRNINITNTAHLDHSSRITNNNTNHTIALEKIKQNVDLEEYKEIFIARNLLYNNNTTLKERELIANIMRKNLKDLAINPMNYKEYAQTFLSKNFNENHELKHNSGILNYDTAATAYKVMNAPISIESMTNIGDIINKVKTMPIKIDYILKIKETRLNGMQLYEATKNSDFRITQPKIFEYAKYIEPRKKSWVEKVFLFWL